MRTIPFVALLWIVIHAQCNIIGIDVGSAFIKVGLVKHGGPFDIVLDPQSKRKISNLIAFDGEERLFGGDAQLVALRLPKSSFPSVNLLLGRNLSHPVVERYVQRHAQLGLKQDPNRGTLVMQMGEDRTLSVEELSAMMFRYVASLATKVSEKEVKECVITIPSFATQFERKAIRTAAELAGLKVLGLVEETTAAAIQYGISRSFSNATTILFVNVGGGSTDCSIMRYSSYQTKQYGKARAIGQFEVLGKSWDMTLGGSEFDDVVYEMLLEQFIHKHPSVPIMDSPRALGKLRKKSVKVKEVLSANEEIPVYIESVIQDIDFAAHMYRAEFEKRLEIRGLLSRIPAVISAALEEASLGLSDIDSVEMIGGGVRVPAVQRVLSEALQREGTPLTLGVHLNGDEAMALGSSIVAANVSSSFRVRKFGVVDIHPFPMGVRLFDMPHVTADRIGLGEEAPERGWTKRSVLFKHNAALNRRKSVTVPHTSDLIVDFYHEFSPVLPAGVPRLIDQYEISGMDEAIKSKPGLEEPKIAISVELDSDGIASVYKAEALFSETKEIKVPVKTAKTIPIKKEAEEEVPPVEAAEEKDSAEEPLPETDEPATDAEKEEEPSEEKEEEPSEEKEGEKVGDEEEKGEEAPVKEAEAAPEPEPAVPVLTYKTETKTVTHRLPLRVSVLSPEQQGFAFKTEYPELAEMGGIPEAPTAGRTLYGVSKKQFRRSRDTLAEFDRADELRASLLSIRNEYEALIYSVRNSLWEEDVEAVSLEETRESLREFLERAEDWIYDSGDAADLAEFQRRLEEIHGMSDAMLERASELTARPETVRAAQKSLMSMGDAAGQLKAHVTDEEKAALLKKIEEVRAWLTEKIAEQEGLEAHETPAFTSMQVKDKMRSIALQLKRLKEKPVPRVKKEKSKKKKKGKRKNSDQNATNTTEDDTSPATPSEEEGEDVAEGETQEPVEEEEEGEDVAEGETQEPVEEEEEGEDVAEGETQEPVEEEEEGEDVAEGETQEPVEEEDATESQEEEEDVAAEEPEEEEAGVQDDEEEE